ncbi:MAG: ribonuclease E/G, partial [Gammaproteobacteria bacterium]|nr:ribonuclease E/G [Gammaproteobacteria bacterium]
GKGVRLTTNLALAARTVVLLPFDTHIGVAMRIVDEDERARLKDLVLRVRADVGTAHGYIARTACQSAAEDQVRADVEDLERLWKRVSRRYGAVAGASDASGEGDTRTANGSLVHEDLPVPTRIVRDLAGPDTCAVVVNHTDTFHRIADYIERCLPDLPEAATHYAGRTPLFEARGLEEAIDRALDRRVNLPSGGSLLIEQTEAMTTVDVNSGRFVDSSDMESTAFTTNLEAARELPGQLRLRNIGGIIVVDFIDMADEDHRREVLDALVGAASGDSARFRASGFSELGLVEISRRRTRESLERQLCDRCETCSGRAFAKSPQSTCYDVFRALRQRAASGTEGVSEYLVRASQPVVDRLLDEEAPYLAGLERDVRRPIRLQVEPGYTSDQFDLVLR